jgi:hypothetical protein
MNTTRLLSTLAAAALTGGIGFAYAQTTQGTGTSTTPATTGTASTQATAPATGGMGTTAPAPTDSTATTTEPAPKVDRG